MLTPLRFALALAFMACAPAPSTQDATALPSPPPAPTVEPVVAAAASAEVTSAASPDVAAAAPAEVIAPAPPARVHVDAGARAEASGDRGAAVEHYVAGAHAGEEGASEALDRLGVVTVSYLAGAHEPLVAAGLPAVSADGKELAFISGDDHGMSDHSSWNLEVRSVGDNAQRFRVLVASTLEEEVAADDEAALAKLAVDRRERLARITARLAKKPAWRPYRQIAVVSDPPELDKPLASPDGLLVVRYDGRRLELDMSDKGEPRVFVRRLPLELAYDIGEPSPEDDGSGPDCRVGAVLSLIASDEATRTLALSFFYDVSGVSDGCGTPAEVMRAFKLPTDKALAGWTKAKGPRRPTP